MFYSCFVLGGIAALILALTTAPDMMTRIMVSMIGIGNIAGGLFMIKREPASILIFDRKSEKLFVRRWHPTGKRDAYYPLNAVSSVEVETTEHAEGGYVYRPRLRLNGSESIPITMFWYQTMQRSEDVIGEIQSFLRLSPNKQLQATLFRPPDL